jgi:hypothetical protein
MNKNFNQLLMEKIIERLEADAKSSSTQTSGQLKSTTTQLRAHVRQLNEAFSRPGLGAPIHRNDFL